MKPGPWWRAQNSCVDHAKLIKLGDKAHRNWFNLVCVASAHGGALPDMATVAIKLRMSESRCAAAIAELVAAKLFDRQENGSFVPHDWDEFQYKIDASDPTNARRQAEHRKKKAVEMKALRALLDASRNTLRNGALHNTVTDVTAKRPEEVSKNITTTVSVERAKESKQDGSLATAQLDSALREPKEERKQEAASSTVAKPVTQVTRGELAEMYARKAATA